jgi:hypothetical protein
MSHLSDVPDGAAPGTPPPRQRSSTPIRWAVTVVATGLSTCALDVFAAAAGALLAASPALDGASRPALLGFLAVTYLLWAAGLRVNVIANWQLLEQTGASTNLPSKVLFELARRRSNTRHAPRAASAVGYVATEIVKEVPYYGGAFGTALLSEALTSTDAIVFIAGTNLGAAVYEYGLARLTRTGLRRRSQHIVRREGAASRPSPGLTMLRVVGRP